MPPHWSTKEFGAGNFYLNVCVLGGGGDGVGVEGRHRSCAPLDTVCVTVKCESWNGPLASRSMGCITGIRVVTF